MARPWSKLVWTRFLTSCFKILLGLKSVFEFLLRLTGPIFVVLGGGLISFAVYVHFTFVLPWYSNGPLLTPSLFTLIHLAMDIWLCIGIAWNYGKSVASRPLQHAIELDPAEVAVLQAASKTGSSRSNTRYCKYCQKGKSSRMHHCHVCNTCIPGMDHHCPWIGNCVGFHNHHHFVLFLLYLVAGCIYAASMSFMPFTVALDSAQPWPYQTSRSSVVFSFILATAVAASVGALSGWQFYLIFTGQTSIEFYIHRENERTARSIGRTYRNPNNQGVQKNFQSFFGVDATKWWFAWLVPGMCNPYHEQPATALSRHAIAEVLV